MVSPCLIGLDLIAQGKQRVLKMLKVKILSEIRTVCHHHDQLYEISGQAGWV